VNYKILEWDDNANELINELNKKKQKMDMDMICCHNSIDGE